jgi:ABC-type methionine transport system ATPase subunit
MKRRILLTYPQDLVPEPVIYRMVKQFDVIPNIRRADVSEDQGWVILELEGSEATIEAALEWVASTGVRVDHAMGEVLEG